jgi:hypothetical protein
MQSIKFFLSDATPAGRRKRSVSGLAVGLVILPVLLGVMACFVLPVPIGNPERSRIDPAMTGVWITKEADDGAWVLVLEPYDKRTWLVSWIFLLEAEAEEEAAVEDAETQEAGESGEEEKIADEKAPGDEEAGAPPSLEEIIILDDEEGQSSLELLREGALEIDGVSAFKGWLKKIKGERFMVWEPKQALWTDVPMVPEFWWVTRVREVLPDALTLDYLNSEFMDLEDVESRSEAERIIRNNIDDPELFFKDFPNLYQRVPENDYEILVDLLEEHGVGSNIE